MEIAQSLVARSPLQHMGPLSAPELATLRAWYQGLDARTAVDRYLGSAPARPGTARATLGSIKARLASFARSRHRQDLAELLEHSSADRLARARLVFAAIETLRTAPPPAPVITDPVDAWLPARIAAPLIRHGIRTLSDLTVQVPRRKRWWTSIAGLGAGAAKEVEALFAAHPTLTAAASLLVTSGQASLTTPWERLVLPTDLNGSRGKFRAPEDSCVLKATNDYEAVTAWLNLQESASTERAYRKEAERLILWAVIERGLALSSLTTEDAIAYRAFLRRPTPKDRWVGPSKPRLSADWKPFQGPLAPSSVAYALSIVNGLFRWLIEQRYVLANPFAGLKVRGVQRSGSLDATRAFTTHEWGLVRLLADNIESTDNWSEPAAQRLRFVLDYWFATGLRPSEFARGTCAQLRRDEQGDDWMRVVGKGNKVGDVAVPLSAIAALEIYFLKRGLPVTRAKWDPRTPLLGSIEGEKAISPSRIRAVLHRFFRLAASKLDEINPTVAEKLRRATPHWLRHTHASHALASGAELTAVRDNLRHVSISTTSTYVHADRTQRARQMRNAFPSKPGAVR